MQLHLIFARAKNGVIGINNTLPWHLPEDLAHFKRTTLGCPVIMGRRTWDSIPPKFRPLPGRTNVVVTRQADWQGLNADGTATSALRADSLEEAMRLCGDVPHAWVIGGAQLYAQALPLATSAVVTEIDISVKGDAFAPAFGSGWFEAAREDHVSASGLRYSFVTMRR